MLFYVRSGIYSVSEHCNMSGPGFTVYQNTATRQAQGLQYIRTLQHVRARVYGVSENCNTSGPGLTVYQNTTTRQAQGLQCQNTTTRQAQGLQCIRKLQHVWPQGLQCIRTLNHTRLEIYSPALYAHHISSRAYTVCI